MNEDEFMVNHSNYRKIIINSVQITNYTTNAISTTKYGVLSFVPLFLYEQFQNYTNCFFLLISIIQQFPEASSLGRFTTVIPLCIILAISAAKEILEDLHRHRDDKKVNQKTVEVFRELRWMRLEWQEVQVGDLVKVSSDEFFPADLLFLKSGAEGGICYIETVNLDGENNLKIRRPVPGLNAESVTELRGVVECDPPNELIYSFNGVLRGDNAPTVPLTADYILLRGSMLRNTNWVVGLVIYTGSDSKIMKNSSNTRSKRSSVSIMVNSQIIVLFVLFLSFTFFHWILFMDWNNENYKEFWYLPISRQDLTDGSTIVLCLVFGVIYSIVIPISLQVMQELSRFIQGIYICNDLDMYYEQMDMPAMAKTSSLNEDLALVKYIFADKTGTLTKNVLEFKCCSVNGVVYDLNQLRAAKVNKQLKDTLHQFFLAVCVCPGVIPVQNKDDISYWASSPDQKALILAAREFGYTLLRRTHNLVELKMHNVIYRFEVLCDFEFSSDRKRTSVILRTPTGQLMLFAIGADDVILGRCVPETKYKAVTQQHLDQFASQGLRSLCVAKCDISKKNFDSWHPAFRKAYEALNNKEKLINEAEAGIVKNLTLLGCTAVEDKLQDDVPETIESLQQAGINIWILTGDKQETAVNIGNSCRLLSNETPTITLNSTDLAKLSRTITRYKRELGDKFGQPGNNYSLVVTGDSLNKLFESKNNVIDFLDLMLSCRSVICCRTTPKQKALIVKNVQKHTSFVTLAIGDGANDVAMIQTASIGVGISGMEGLQAANAADYSIGQFKYLKKLLLVHGTWSYNRICKMIYFIHYKNLMVTTSQFYYTSTTAWSGQVHFDRWAKMLYNVMLTGAPTLAMGIFEQNLPAHVLLKNPFVYTKNNWFNLKTFCLCLMNAFFHSVMLSWLSLSVFDSSVFWSCGYNDNYTMVGNVVYTCLITIVCLKSGLHTYHFTNVTFLFLIFSEVCWLLVLTILSHTWPWIYVGEDMPRMMEILFATPLFWFYMLFIIVAILFLDFAAGVLYRTFCDPVTNSLRIASIRGRNQLGILT